ncbi:CYTH domain-containing protein [Synechococcus sp. RSCCF101]|uniref:CYTH domain-containing protein n=1 Tax=Synechococcus sp. RSCCF101 TaxID=2511069 RepID=UPI001245F97F|nr:CYTH domain-containing protein [Synechococcus sp. RSCCF101]QEY32873.1 CYTH domain-containing protein [Synechococcus sp. RSCCF101]
MAVEIERRFLVRSDGWRAHVRHRDHLHQGYLVREPVSLRVRLGDAGRAWLTIKARFSGGDAERSAFGTALARQEFEYTIPAADAADLLELSSCRLEKVRHTLAWPGGEWVVDEFLGANAPLILCEVEPEDPRAPLTLPEWCGPEISGRRDLSNAALAEHPLKSWTEEQRRAVAIPTEQDRV